MQQSQPDPILPSAAATVQDLGALRRFSNETMTKVNVFDSPRMFCDLYCLEPGQEQSPHTHVDSDKIYAVLDGEAVATLGDDEVLLRPGQAVMAAPGVRHGIANRSPGRCVVLVFMTPKPVRGNDRSSG